jgi:hypothetical protein
MGHIPKIPGVMKNLVSRIILWRKLRGDLNEEAKGKNSNN